jgi:SAM-dependent methyltransferase
MASSPGDHFSSVAARYAQSRPSYPRELAAFLAGVAPGHALAWDCATGNGQAALLLADHFARVVATDLSEAQLKHATPHPRVEYRLGRESESGLDPQSCDLVIAAQAAHWFDPPAFYAEVRRVAKPSAVIAIWGYARIAVNPEIDNVLRWFEYERVERYWPPGREIARDEYRSLPFPFARLDAPPFTIEREWTCSDMLDMLSSTSAAARCREIEGADPVADVTPKLEPLWGSERRLVRWPIHMLIGRVE